MGEIARSDIIAKLDEGVDISEAFWMNIEDDMTSMFNEEDRLLLNQVFNPALSDRRTEGDRFVHWSRRRWPCRSNAWIISSARGSSRKMLDHFSLSLGLPAWRSHMTASPGRSCTSARTSPRLTCWKMR